LPEARHQTGVELELLEKNVSPLSSWGSVVKVVEKAEKRQDPAS
jgi:hypothetical protein